MTARRILMGAIGRPHGVRGLVHVHSYASGDLADYAPLLDEAGRRWRLAWRSEGIAELRDEAGRPLADRSAAERLVNTKLYVERDALPAPASDEFYLADLVGMRAVGADGAEFGRVVQVHDYGAGASLEIVAPGRAVLILPFTKACVPEVDLGGGVLRVVPPEEIALEPPSGEAPDRAQRGEARP